MENGGWKVWIVVKLGQETKENEYAQAGSKVSMSILRYTGLLVPTRSLIFLMIPSVPIESIARASTISKPQ